MRLRFLFTLLTGLMAFASPSFANEAKAKPNGGFSSSLPAYWVRTDLPHEQTIFVNTRSSKFETLAVRVVRLPATPHMKPSALKALQSSISADRARQLRIFGISAYSVLSFDLRERATGVDVLEMESRYTNIQRHDVQMAERHFFTRNAIYQVTYSEETSAFTDRQHVRQLLDGIAPRTQTAAAWEKMLWSEALADEVKGTSGEPPAPIAALGAVDDSDKPVGPDATSLANGSLPPQCQDMKIKEEEKRKPGDPPFLSLAGTGQAGLGCLKALGQMGVEAAEGLVAAAKAAPSLNPITAMRNGVSHVVDYASDPVYRAETNTSIVGAYETVKHLPENAIKAVQSLGNTITTWVKSFPCLNLETQWRISCRVVAEAGTTVIAGAGVFKLAKGAYSAYKAAQLGKVIDMVAGAEVAEGSAKTAANTAGVAETTQAGTAPGAAGANAPGAAAKATRPGVSAGQGADVAPLTDAQKADQELTARKAADSIGPDAAKEHADAIYRAHIVGTGEVGADGTPARAGNYTKAQLLQKAKILADDKVSIEARRKLMEDSVVGASDGYVGSSVQFGRSSGGVTSNMGMKGVPVARQVLDKGDVTTANKLFREAGDAAASKGSRDYALSMYANAGDRGGYATALGRNREVMVKEVERLTAELKNLQADLDQPANSHRYSEIYYRTLMKNNQAALEEVREHIRSLDFKD